MKEEAIQLPDRLKGLTDGEHEILLDHLIAQALDILKRAKNEGP